MIKRDNYAIQARQAKQRFLTYDSGALAAKMGLEIDEGYLYLTMLGSRHRLSRADGSLERLGNGLWTDANSFGEVMTVLDWVCDSRADRRLAGRWKNMSAFGLMFHQNLVEGKNPWAERFEADLPGFRRACRALGGQEFPQGDAAFVLPLFPELPVVVQLWLGDEEFPASLRFLWDENATCYLRYETMHFARGLILQRLGERMQSPEQNNA